MSAHHTPPPFVQIASAYNPAHERVALHALDESGSVWVYVDLGRPADRGTDACWHKLAEARTTIHRAV